MICLPLAKTCPNIFCGLGLDCSIRIHLLLPNLNKSAKVLMTRDISAPVGSHTERE